MLKDIFYFFGIVTMFAIMLFLFFGPIISSPVYGCDQSEIGESLTAAIESCGPYDRRIENWFVWPETHTRLQVEHGLIVDIKWDILVP